LIVMNKKNDGSRKINNINKGKKAFSALLLALGIGLAVSKCSTDVDINIDEDIKIENDTELETENTENIEIESTEEIETESESTEDDKDDEDIFHFHDFTKWKFYDEDNEIATCKICDESKFRNHKLNIYQMVMVLIKK